MKKRSNIEKTFGPFAFTALILFLGILFIPFGLIFSVLADFEMEIKSNLGEIVITFLISALILLILAFFAFTTTCSIIDYDKKRIKYATKLCGIFSIGKWTYLTPDMTLGIKKTTERWGMYSRSNRSISLDYNNLIIMLYDSEDMEIIPIKKIKKAKRAEAELEKLGRLLELKIS